MITQKVYNTDNLSLVTKKIADYVQLIKMRLTLLVVFSAAITFAYAAKGNINWLDLFLLVLGGFLTTGAANGFNQIIEKDLDKLMDRTKNRPLPSGRMHPKEAIIASVLMGITGVAILGLCFNLTSAVLGLFAILSYAFVYTPLKQKTPFAVFVGAFPGAIPPMLGWVAMTNDFGLEAGIFFAIQFIWQFPHFWAIAWVLDEDYKKAGFSLLPSSGGRNKSSAFQTMLYTLILIPISLLPVRFEMAGMIFGTTALICGALFFMQAVNLFRKCTIKAAHQLMFGSFFYLPIIQVLLLIDKLG